MAVSNSKPGTKTEAISEILQFLRRIFKAIQNYSEEIQRGYGVTGPQLWAIRIIYREGHLSMGELSRRMYLHMSTVSGIVDRLAEKGYVERRKEETDRRVIKIYLTKAGKRLVQKAPVPAQGKLLHGLDGLSHRQVEGIRFSLKKVVRLMEIEDIKSVFFFSDE